MQVMNLFEKAKDYPIPLRISLVEGMFAALMSGGAMVFIIPFAVFLGADSFQIGLVTALPALVAAWFQIASLKLLDKYRSRRKIIIFSVGIQAVSWLAIAAIPFLFKSNGVEILIAVSTIGTVIGSIGTPLWQSWMRSLTPREILGNYFGYRQAITGFVVFVVTVICGLALDIAEPNYVLIAFVAIFLLGFIGRSISAFLFTKIDEPEFDFEHEEKTSVLKYLGNLGKDNFGHFLLFGTLLTFAISLTAPFTTLYFLNDLHLSDNYLLYTALIAASSVATFISMPYWGRIIDKFGTVKVLQATSFLVCFYPFFLFFIRDPYLFLAVQVFDGVVYSGFILSLTNFIYVVFKPEKMIPYAAVQSVLFGTGTFAAAMISGYAQMFGFSIGLISTSFYLICLISFVLRLAIVSTYSLKIKEVARTAFITRKKIILKAVTFEPLRENFHDNFTIAAATTVKMLNTAEIDLLKAEHFAVEEFERAEKIAASEIKRIVLPHAKPQTPSATRPTAKTLRK